MLLEECKYVVSEKFAKCIIGHIELSSDSDKENSDEDNSDEENSFEEILMRKFLKKLK